MSFKKSKKVSAFQVYSEDQIQSRRGRMYRNMSPNSRTSSFDSPPRRNERSLSHDRILDSDLDRHSRGRRRSSDDDVDARYHADVNMYRDRGESDSPDRETGRYTGDAFIDSRGSGDRYRDRYGDRAWNDTGGSRDRSGSRDQHNRYLVVEMKDRERGGAKYSDSDDECLHESLRRNKHPMSYSSEDERPHWGSDRFLDYGNDYRQERKRGFSDQHRDSLSPPPKLWRRNSGEQDRTIIPETGKFSDRGRLMESESFPKKKKGKGKKNQKMKDRKQGNTNLQKRDRAALSARGKIPSLLDLEFPPNLAARTLEPGSSDILPSFNSKMSSFGYGNRQNDSTDKSLPRYEARGKVSSRDSFPRDSRYRRRSNDSDDERRRPLGDFDNSDRRSPEYDRYFDERDRHRRSSYSADFRETDLEHASSNRRNRCNSSDYRDPEVRIYSDSEQDSDREGARRSWREERRDHQPKRKTDSRDESRGRRSGEAYSSLSKPEAKKQKESEGNSRKERERPQRKEKEKRTEPEKIVDPAARFHVVQCSDGLAVLLTHPQEICLRGRAQLRVLAGAVSIMGYKITAEHARSYNLYSPTSASLLTINTCSVESDKKVLRKVLKSLDVEEKTVKEFMSGAVILKAQQLLSPGLDYICTLPPYTQLFKFNIERCAMTSSEVSEQMVKMGAAFFPVQQAPNLPLKWSSTMESGLEKWIAHVKKSGEKPVAVLCGGQNTGKSTFTRYMVNAALNIVPKVCYLNCDVGQTEFSPPGCVSLTVIEEPILGPPFCHQKPAERMCFYGLTSPADGPTRYVQCLQYVWQAYQRLDPAPPLVVNTMGWNEGLGLKLFVDVLALTSPDLVIQINSSNPTLNFPTITTEFSALEAGWLYNTESVADEKTKLKSAKKHELVTVDSLVNNRIDSNRIKLTPRNLRDLSLLAHLMEDVHPTLTLTSAAPYAVPWSKLAVHVCHAHIPHRLIWAALNASVVALCKADLSETKRTSENSPLFFEETPVCDCLGYGVVRAVDTDRQLVYIITSLPRSRLADVNTLLKGAINIPDQIFLKQTNLAEVPYVDALAPAMALAPVRPRSRMPRRTGTSNN